MRRATEYLVSIPERILRAVAAALGGTIHETAELVLPRLVRTSRFYEATAKNLLRITRGARRRGRAPGRRRSPARSSPRRRSSPCARRAGTSSSSARSSRSASRRSGSSPPRPTSRAARASISTRSSSELKAAGVLAKEAEFASVDDLLAALEGASGTTARLIDIPPLEVEGLKRSLADLRDDAKGLPDAARARGRLPGARRGGRPRAALAARGLRGDGPRVLQLGPEGRTPARARPVHGGPAAGARRGLRRRTRGASDGPYAQAVARHFDPRSRTLTERGLGRLTTPKLLESEAMAHPNSFGARSTLDVGGTSREIFRLDALQASHDILRLPVHAARPARERPAHGGRRRASRRRTSRPSPAGSRAAEPSQRDLVHAGPRAAPGLHRRPGRRRPRRDAQRDARPRRRPGEDQPAPPRRARHRPLGAGRRVRERAARSSGTPSSSSSGTASATRSCAGGRARSTTSRSSRRAPGSSTRSTSSSSRASSTSATASRSPTRSSGPTRTRR